MRQHRIGLGMILVLLLAIAPTQAQESITLTLAVPEWQANLYDDALLGEFEAQFPGVQVDVKSLGQDAFFSPAGFAIEDHMQGLETLASSGDVFYVNNFNLSAYGTRAGYFLDLAPLVQVDGSLEEADFIPSVWESFQWDGGFWALPIAADVSFLIYQPEVFDAQNLAYPRPDWTLEDFTNAARTLSTYDDAGEVSRSGFFTFQPALLLRALAGRGYYDLSTIPNQPQLNAPEIVALLTEYKSHLDEGIIGTRGTPEFGARGPNAPITMGRGSQLADFSFGPAAEDVPEQVPVLLPGGVATLDVEALALSGGTAYPELAYELAKFLSQDVVVANQFGGRPARYSVANAPIPEDAPIFTPEFSPESTAFLEEAFANALPVREMRYTSYLETILIDDSVTDVAARVEEQQQLALTNMQLADSDEVTIAVEGVEPLPELAPGEVGLTFGLAATISPLPNRESWDAFAEEFAANNPDVGYVQIETVFGGGDPLYERYDCYYAGFPQLQTSPVVGDVLLNIDPFLDADSTINRDDFIGDSLSLMQVDGLTYGYPLQIQPFVLRYSVDAFIEAGLPLPEGSWTIDTFVDALQTLYETDNTVIPFDPFDSSNSHLLMIIAAYGGVPLDSSTNPPTINFTDPQTVTAIQEALELVRAGYIDYDESAASGGGGGGFGQDIPPLVTERLTAFSFGTFGDEMTQLITFPTGEYTPLSYSVTGAYISRTAQNPAICYRLIRALSQRPDLFSAMPALESEIVGLENVVDPDYYALFNQFVEMVDDPNGVRVTDIYQGAEYIGSFVLNYWFARTLDQHVLEGADLEAELAIAQENADSLIACIDTLPQQTSPEDRARFEGFQDCVLLIDPTLEFMFPSRN